MVIDREGGVQTGSSFGRYALSRTAQREAGEGGRSRAARQLWSYVGLGIVMCSSADWLSGFPSDHLAVDVLLPRAV